MATPKFVADTPAKPPTRKGGTATQTLTRRVKDNALSLEPNSPWFYKACAARWQFVANEDGTSGEWLPDLGLLRIEPGVGGVESNRDWGTAQFEAQRRGWALIPIDACEDVVGSGGYVADYPTIHGRPVYLSVFDEVKQVGTQCIVKFDWAHYNEFRRGLIRDGIVNEIDPDVAALMMARVERDIEFDMQRDDDASRKAVAKHEKKLSAMRASLEAQ